MSGPTVEIIAEIANAHQGDPAQAVRLAEAALNAGADAVKFQSFAAHRVAAPDDLLPQAIALAEEIAANPDPQLRMIKELLSRNGSETDYGRVQRLESEMLRECWKSPEHKEAVAAFLAKRPPRFR